MNDTMKNLISEDDERILKRVEERNKRLNTLLNVKKSEAIELSLKLQDLEWKMKRTDFISYYEEKEREEERGKIKKLNEQINLVGEKWYDTEIQIEEYKKKVNNLTDQKTRICIELQRLNERDQINESALSDLRRSINILKNRNAAMMLKLKKQKQEFDEQIQFYTAQLNESY